MAFVGKSKSKSGNQPENHLVIKVNTSKGFVTLGKVGLFDESALHSQVAKLTPEQLIKLLAKAELSIVPNNGNASEEIELVL